MARPPRFPRPRLGDKNYRARVLSWLDSTALRLINSSPDRSALLDIQLGITSDAGRSDRAALIDELIALAWDGAGDLIAGTYADMGGGSGNSNQVVRDIDGRAALAVDFALDGWEPKAERIRRWAVHAGAKSKRPPVYSPEMLLPHDGLPVREQASKLGCSTATVKRLRKALKDRVAASTAPPRETVQVEPRRRAIRVPAYRRSVRRPRARLRETPVTEPRPLTPVERDAQNWLSEEVFIWAREDQPLRIASGRDGHKRIVGESQVVFRKMLAIASRGIIRGMRTFRELNLQSAHSSHPFDDGDACEHFLRLIRPPTAVVPECGRYFNREHL